MSDALKKLEEIEADARRWVELAGSYPTRNTDDGTWCNADQWALDEMIQRVGSETALLTRLVRLAVDTTCCGATTGQACILEPSDVWCVPCRIRRELSGGVRSEA